MKYIDTYQLFEKEYSFEEIERNRNMEMYSHIEECFVDASEKYTIEHRNIFNTSKVLIRVPWYEKHLGIFHFENKGSIDDLLNDSNIIQNFLNDIKHVIDKISIDNPINIDTKLSHINLIIEFTWENESPF